MLIHASRLTGTPILSVQASAPIASVVSPVVDPDNLKIIALRVAGPAVNIKSNLLDTKSIREYSQYGIVIDSEDEFISVGDVVKIKDVLALNFQLNNLRVETKKGSKLGHVSDFTLNSDDFIVQQIIVKRPLVKSFVDPELTIHRREIVEITDNKIIIKDEEKVLKARAAKEDFVPNFVNPFRTDPTFATTDAKDQKEQP